MLKLIHITLSGGPTIGLPNSPTSVPHIDEVVNTFEVTIYNNTSIDDGTATPDYQEVTDVEVGFSVATWGLPSNRLPEEWMKIPSDLGDNPITGLLVPAQDEPGHPFRVTMPWTLTWGDLNDEPHITYYNTSPHEHQCVLVELDAISTANILTRSVYRNMDFVTASEFSRKAVISARGYGQPGTGKENHTFYLNVTKKDWVIKNDPKGEIRTKGASNPEEDKSYLYYSVNGYIATGNSVIIKGEKCELVEPVGSFGYIVEHGGEVDGWVDDIEGAEKVDENTYVLEIPPETVAEIVTHIKPILPPVLSLSLHGGLNFPLSNFANDYGMGFNVMADIGYEINRRFSVMAFFAYNFFPAKSSGTDDTSIINIAFNGAYRVPINPGMALSLRLGPDLYIQDFKDIDFGYNVGLSYLHLLSPRLELEAGVDYHSHFNQDNWFLQSHVGIIFKF